jgi:DNA-binding beta-propeller fold protein YncE
MVAGATLSVTTQSQTLSLTVLGTYETRIFDRGASEIVEYDPDTRRAFVVNAQLAGVDVLDVVDPRSPRKIAFIDASMFGGIVNSVDIHNGVLAVAIESSNAASPGTAAFYRTTNLQLLGSAPTGVLPDMITFTPDGRYVLTANEAQPNASYTIDPEGSVTIVDMLTGAATTVGFGAANGFAPELRAAGVRIFGPGASPAQDFEPEYIAVSPDSRTAYVTLQENNAIAVLDIAARQFTRILPLGYKNHMLPGAGIDASDRDNAAYIGNYPVFGMYQPDAIAAYTVGGQTLLVTANEGDAREYTAFVEEVRASTLKLDPVAFPNAAFIAANGRLGVTRSLGDTDGDGDWDRLYAFGGRSFSIWDTDGNLVFDSGDALERITAARYPTFFNASNSNNTFDDRSDNKGPEPEGLVIAELNGRTYVFIGLERTGGVVTYDISDPRNPVYVDYTNNRNFSGNIQQFTAGDLGPEGLAFVSARSSPTGRPMLIVGNEISGSTTFYDISVR